MKDKENYSQEELVKKIEKARKKAKEIVKEFGLNPPISFTKILTKYKIKLFMVESLEEIIEITDKKYPGWSWENVWGVIQKRKKECNVYISNKIKYENSKRFTLAHELGHFFLDWEEKDSGKDIYYRNKNLYSRDEQPSDEFAINILIPDESEFIELWNNNITDSEMANHYGVPLVSIAIYKKYLLSTGKLYV